MEHINHGAGHRPPGAINSHSHSQKSTPRSTPVPLPPFQSHAAQPPAPSPFSGSFPPRDPFMPGAQHNRRASHSTLAGTPQDPYPRERAWTSGQGHLHPQYSHHQPQIPSSHFVNGHSLPAATFDSARRGSLGASGSPPRYVGGPLEPPPPPPPPSFVARNMPPPSPSSNPLASFGAPRGPPTVSPFVGIRDLPSLGSRPGGGMSISSLIGNDVSKHTEPDARASTTQNSPTFKSPRSRSPQRPRSTSVRSEYSHIHRPTSPRHGTHGHHPEARTAYDSNRMMAVASNPFGAQINAPSHRQYPSSPTSTNGEHAHPAVYGPPQRPNSQPTKVPQEHGQSWRARPPPAQTELTGFRAFNYQPSHGLEHIHHQMPLDRHVETGHTAEAGVRRPRSPEHSGFGPSHTPLHEDYAGLFRPAYHPAHASGEAQSFHAHDFRVREHQQHSPAPSEGSGLDGRFRHFGGLPPFERDERARMMDQARRDGDDGPHSHRAFLNLSPELSRKNGRGSPMPQAVQGAQPRPGLPGRDPSVKNEFGRMFSGLGSGVGGSSTPTAGLSANGTTTPSRMSPPRFIEGRDALQSAELENMVDALDSVSREQKIRKSKEDEEGLDGRNTPTASQRSKRAKLGHPTHHHHHHAHAHHHHHHHHAPEEVVPPNSGFSTIRFAPNVNSTRQGSITGSHHHLHHHAGHVHHHHHNATKAPIVPLVAAPEILIRDQAVLQSIADRPRSHLGSALYSKRLAPASNKRSTLESKFAFESSAIPIPRFDDKANCTFTVRVPREYLRSSEQSEKMTDSIAGGLEEICRRRAVWGTGIYTDDSDVVAAAVHSGWIKGDFAEFNEDLRDLFDLPDEGPSSPISGPRKLKDKPNRPVQAPVDLDVHITVLILPPLEDYVASTMYNLRSRSWGPDHDGMSFKIHSIDFVDEPNFSRFTERSGAARRQRMNEEYERRQAAESLLGLTGGGNSVSVGA